MAVTNLAQYYTGKNMALPSVSNRASLYSSYGLGSDYSGTASQNASLLSKLNTTTAPTTPNGTSSGGYGGTSTSGYSQTPMGAPQPVSNDPGINDLTSFTQNNATSRSALVNRLNQELSGSYDKFAGESGLTDAATTMNTIRNALAKAGQLANNTPLQVNENTKGTFQNDAQRAEEIQTELIPQQANIANLGIALTPAENAYQTAQQVTQSKVDLLKESQARDITGFDQSAEMELQAIQAKVARGQALTDQEFNRETELTKSKMAYDATVQAAGTSAGATLGAANINSTASKQIAAQEYPGISVAPGTTAGSYVGALPNYLQNLYSNPSQNTTPFGPSIPSTAPNTAINNAASRYFK